MSNIETLIGKIKNAKNIVVEITDTTVDKYGDETKYQVTRYYVNIKGVWTMFTNVSRMPSNYDEGESLSNYVNGVIVDVTLDKIIDDVACLYNAENFTISFDEDWES